MTNPTIQQLSMMKDCNFSMHDCDVRLDVEKRPCWNCGRRHSPYLPEVLMHADGFPLQPDDILNLLRLPSNDPNWHTGVGRIGEEYVVKYANCTRLAEAENSEFVRKHTDIPVPKVFLVFCSNGRIHIVSRFIKGRPLNELWDQLNTFQKEEVTARVASYLHKLQRLTPPSKPGPVNPLATWRGRWLVEDLEPLPSHAALVDWLNHKRDVAKRFHQSYRTPPFSTNYPLVFTHGDIASRNCILDDNDIIWLVDWDRAGWYPVYMEYATIAADARQYIGQVEGAKEWVEAILSRLMRYDSEFGMLRFIDWALQVAPLA